MINEVIIPASGLGVRMLSVTEGKISKLMLNVNNIPIIDYAIKEAINSGFNKIYTTINELHKDLYDFIKKNHPYVNIILEKEVQGSAQSILKCKSLIKNDFFAVVFPDILIKSNVPALLQLKRTFEKENCNIVGWIMPEDRNLFGNCMEMKLETDNSVSKIIKFLPKNEKGKERYISKYIISKSFFNICRNKVDDSDVLIEMLNNEKFLAVKIEGKGFDLGNPEGYRKFISP